MTLLPKIIFSLVLLVAIVGAVALVMRPSEPQLVSSVSSVPTSSFAKPLALVGAATPAPATLILGDANAPVTLVEYGDFQCPICGRFFRQIEPRITEEYINKGIVKLEFRVFPYIGSESVLAGQAAYCANEQGAFSAYHDGLFAMQAGENSGVFNPGALKNLAGSIGLQREQFDLCLDTSKYKSVVEAGLTEAKNRGVTSTPTIFIGDRKVVGAQPFTTYKTLIDEQL